MRASAACSTKAWVRDPLGSQTKEYCDGRTADPAAGDYPLTIATTVRKQSGRLDRVTTKVGQLVAKSDDTNARVRSLEEGQDEIKDLSAPRPRQVILRLAARFFEPGIER
ncbi:predicted protein [Mycobacterium tuberculosis T85]|nr:predicted protein [Mycobacterium tuberculosis T85]